MDSRQLLQDRAGYVYAYLPLPRGGESIFEKTISYSEQVELLVHGKTITSPGEHRTL